MQLKRYWKLNCLKQELILPKLPPGQDELIIRYSVYRAQLIYYQRRGLLGVRKSMIRRAGVWLAIFVGCMLLFWLMCLLHIPIGAINIPIYACIFIYGYSGLTGPTHIQIGAQGMRFHWLYFMGLFSSPWIEWPWIYYLSSAKFSHGLYCKFQSIDLYIAKERLPRKIFWWLILFSPTFWSGKSDSKSIVFRLNADAITHDADRVNFINAIQSFLGPDQIAPELSQWQSNFVSSTFTKFWLDRLEDSSNSKRELKALSEGEILSDGQYAVVKRIAAGGQAVTYLAQRLDVCNANSKPLSEPQRSGDTVILKEFVLPVRGGIEIRRRALENVEHEAILLKQLDHPQIVKLLDAFVEHQKAYLVLEYIDGLSLRKLVEKNGPFDERKVIGLSLQMMDLLQYLHEQKPSIIHRDFTPDNLLLRSDGKLALIDFNVAEQLVSECTKTVVGKHCYIPPEQFRGKAMPQSDLYACGATIFWLLTGQDPEPISTSHPRLLNSLVSVQLDNIVAKATNSEITLRYGAAVAMKQELDKLYSTTSDPETMGMVS